MIAGFVETTRGRITLDGRDITHMPPNRRGRIKTASGSGAQEKYWMLSR